MGSICHIALSLERQATVMSLQTTMVHHSELNRESLLMEIKIELR